MQVKGVRRLATLELCVTNLIDVKFPIPEQLL